MSDIAITGIGCISPLGQNMADTWSSLKKGISAIDTISGFEDTDLKIPTAAQIKDFKPEDHFSSSQVAILDRHTQLALVAAREAVADAQLQPQELKKLGCIIGTACGGKETDDITCQKLYLEKKKRVHPFTILRGMYSAASSQISIEHGIQGPVFTLASACSSTNHAIIQAILMIRSGLADAVLAGGTDAPFTYGLLKSWEALRVLSPETCRPFSADRKGLVLGEGSGMVIIESLQHAKRRGARIHALIHGIGMSADAAHITDPSSEGAARTMEAALNDADLKPEEIAYINAHGTGTIQNDPSETRAIRQVFGNHADHLLVSSTKSMHGHSLGAAGAIELIAVIKSLQDSIVPPTVNFTEAGQDCDLNYVPNKAISRDYQYALSNSFAFGGLNAVLVAGKAP